MVTNRLSVCMYSTFAVVVEWTKASGKSYWTDFVKIKKRPQLKVGIDACTKSYFLNVKNLPPSRPKVSKFFKSCKCCLFLINRAVGWASYKGTISKSGFDVQITILHRVF